MGKIKVGENSEAAMADPFIYDAKNIDQFSKIFEAKSHTRKYAGCNAFAFSEKSEQKMLRPDKIMTQATHLIES